MQQQIEREDVVQVLDVSLYAKDIPSAIRTILSSCLNDEKLSRCVSATGAHGMVFARKNKEFGQLLENFYLNLPDGMPGVWIGRIKGAKQMKRCYGPEFFKEMMIQSARLPITHYFCGGSSGVAEKLKKSVSGRFNNNNVAGIFCPPFLPVDQYDYDTLAKPINDANVNIVWIGLSTPKQEQFAYYLSKRIRVNYVIAVGAAFDFHIDKVRQAPPLIQKAGMEWLFRLIMEPGRLFKRYFEIVPMFIYYNLKELFSFAKN